MNTWNPCHWLRKDWGRAEQVSGSGNQEFYMGCVTWNIHIRRQADCLRASVILTCLISCAVSLIAPTPLFLTDSPLFSPFLCCFGCVWCVYSWYLFFITHQSLSLIVTLKRTWAEWCFEESLPALSPHQAKEKPVCRWACPFRRHLYNVSLLDIPLSAFSLTFLSYLKVYISHLVKTARLQHPFPNSFGRTDRRPSQ